MLQFLNMTVDLSISLCNSINFCFIYFETKLYDTYSF